MRRALGTVLVLLATPLAFSVPHAVAQTTTTQTPTPPAAATKPHVPMRERFAAANTTHDGHLTLDQAQAAGWRGVARHFAEIDATHKGYVTLDDIRAFHRARKAARSGAQPGAPSSTPGEQ